MCATNKRFDKIFFPLKFVFFDGNADKESEKISISVMSASKSVAGCVWKIMWQWVRKSRRHMLIDDCNKLEANGCLAWYYYQLPYIRYQIWFFKLHLRVSLRGVRESAALLNSRMHIYYLSHKYQVMSTHNGYYGKKLLSFPLSHYSFHVS